jgi:hypothetical protein
LIGALRMLKCFLFNCGAQEVGEIARGIHTRGHRNGRRAPGCLRHAGLARARLARTPRAGKTGPREIGPGASVRADPGESRRSHEGGDDVTS